MAITRGNNTTPNYSAVGASSYTQALTCTASSNTVLLVGVGLDDTDNISSVTYNGVSMTQLHKLAMFGRGAGGGYIYIYGLANPDTGSSYNITATRSAGSGRIFMGGVEYKDCSATIPDATGGSAPGGTFSSQSISVTTSADNSIVFGFVVADNGSITAGAGTTLIAENGVASGQVATLESSPLVVTPAGLTTLSVTTAASCNGGSIGVSLAPPATASNHFLSLLGIGA